MEPNETSGLSSSYYHHHPQQQQPPPPSQTTTTTTAASPTNGIAPNPNNGVPSSGASSQMVYSHAVPSAVATPLETVKRKRGRPRKYGTPEQAAAAKRLAASASSPVSAPPKKKYQGFAVAGSDSAGAPTKKSQLAALGTTGQSFVPHVINVNAGEDVSQKIMLLMQQSKRELCIVSATGSISNASLRQPATSGGNISYEGRFDIISLTGSYVRTELGGRTGGLSVCLSSSDGQIIGGGVAGPLTAAGPIQIIAGSFLIDTKKEMTGGVKGGGGGDTSSGGGGGGNKLQSPTGGGGGGGSGISFRSPVDSSGHQIPPYMVPPPGMHMEWSGNSADNGGDYIPD